MNLRQQISERPWILAVAVSVLVLLWMYSGSFEAPTLNTTETISAPGTAPGMLTRVQIRSQLAEPIVRFIRVYGQTAPARTIELSAETEGRVIAIGTSRGQRLRKGDVILRLDLRDRDARLAQAKASVREHRTSYEAQLKLKPDGYVSDTQIAETLAKLETAKAELRRAELDLEYMVVRAPFDGVLQERDVEIGDFVRSGDNVATVVDNTSIIVSGTIAEQDARFVQVNGSGRGILATGQEVEGRIRYIAPVADQSTRTFNVELEVKNPDGSLPAGVTAEMKLPGGTIIAQKISPALLTLDADGNIGVKVVDEYDRVEFFEIELARSDPDGVWVSGLPDAARVIVVGQGYVMAGQVVEPVLVQADTALAETTAAETQPEPEQKQ
jgi:multidrug efflux system membrane fusion protein